eukprot:gene23031-29220_t
MSKYLSDDTSTNDTTAPHVWKISQSAFSSLKASRTRQAIVISGESGAGKTEATKKCLQYLSAVAHSAHSKDTQTSSSQSTEVPVEDRSPSAYRYLNQSGNVRIEGVDDHEEYLATLQSIKKLGFSDSSRDTIFNALKAILLLGNVDFVAVTAKSLDVNLLRNSFIERSLTIRGEKTIIPFDLTSAVDARNALAKEIYELELYAAEGVAVQIEVLKIDNTDVLVLIEDKKRGIFAKLDDELKLPKSTDESFLKKIEAEHNVKKNAERRFVMDIKMGKTQFEIRHFAGTIRYDVKNFMEKNRDKLHEHLEDLLGTSKHGAFCDIMTSYSPTGLANTATPHFIKCIKPNNTKQCNVFETEMIKMQSVVTDRSINELRESIKNQPKQVQYIPQNNTTNTNT